jgi:biopolymer transport protein ExbB
MVCSPHVVRSQGIPVMKLLHPPLSAAGCPWPSRSPAGIICWGIALLLVAPPCLFGQSGTPVPNGELRERWEPAWGPEDDWREAGMLNGDEGDEAGASQPSREVPSLNLLELFWQSRWWMLPILIMSFIVIAVSVERALSLRRARVVPRRLERELLSLADRPQGIDPREALRICQRYPSAAASVVRAMLLKIGRTSAELEQTVREASDREAQRLYSSVRWLNLASGVTPLMGLMGTVWGMIRAFHDTTQMAPGLNKAEYLAEGIYLALVTTLGGLAVAIPATILAHFFEGRVVSLFHHVDELVLQLMPTFERSEASGHKGAETTETTSGGERIGTEAGPRSNTTPYLEPGPMGPAVRPSRPKKYSG